MEPNVTENRRRRGMLYAIDRNQPTKRNSEHRRSNDLAQDSSTRRGDRVSVVSNEPRIVRHSSRHFSQSIVKELLDESGSTNIETKQKGQKRAPSIFENDYRDTRTESRHRDSGKSINGVKEEGHFENARRRKEKKKKKKKEKKNEQAQQSVSKQFISLKNKTPVKLPVLAITTCTFGETVESNNYLPAVPLSYERSNIFQVNSLGSKRKECKGNVQGLVLNNPNQIHIDMQHNVAYPSQADSINLFQSQPRESYITARKRNQALLLNARTQFQLENHNGLMVSGSSPTLRMGNPNVDPHDLLIDHNMFSGDLLLYPNVFSGDLHIHPNNMNSQDLLMNGNKDKLSLSNGHRESEQVQLGERFFGAQITKAQRHRRKSRHKHKHIDKNKHARKEKHD